jgi:hypothetical protein
MPAVQITRFGGPDILDIVDIPEPVPGPSPRLGDQRRRLLVEPVLGVDLAPVALRVLPPADVATARSVPPSHHSSR